MSVPVPRPPASEAELRSVAALVQDVFQDAATTAAHLALVDRPEFEPASLPAIWSDRGNAIATVQAVPCEVALLGTWLPAGIITMVATRAEARDRGHMRACMQAAHDWLLEQQRPLAVLYGVPAIYPRFGYRPVMPRSEIRYSTPASDAVQMGNADSATFGTAADLFNRQEVSRPCAVRRGASEWAWTSAHDRTSLRTLEANGDVTGYARLLDDGPPLTVVEAACAAGHESALLDAIHSHARWLGLDNIALRLMPDHPLAVDVGRRATWLELNDVEIRVTPPQAGMLCVLDSEATLEHLRPRIEAQLNGRSLRIRAGSHLNLSFGSGPESVVTLGDPADLAHLLSGYPGPVQMRQWGLLQADDQAIALTSSVFPMSWPRWTIEPFWGE